MIQIMRRYITLALIAVCCTGVIRAQQEGLPSRSLTIEGAYNPTMTGTEKLSPVPERRQTDHKPAQVSYITDSNPMTNLERHPMGAFSQSSDDVKQSIYSGLVRFGYGLRNVHDGVADFRWHISDRDDFHISGLLDAWASNPISDWRSRMLNGDLTARYTHRFDSFTFSLDATYGHSHFNYMPGADMDSAKSRLSSLMQKVNRGGVGVALKGSTNDVNWHFGAGMEFLSRNGLVLAGTDKDNRERLLRIEGGAEMPFKGGIGGVDYSQKTAIYDWQGLNGSDYGSFTTFTLSPYWRQTWGKLNAGFGLNLDVRTAAGHKVMLSPMITVSYDTNEQLRLLAGLTGGLQDNSMRTLGRISPYWSEEERIRDGYQLMNLSAGFAYRYGTWLNVSLKAGYRHTLDELFQVRAESLIVTSMLRQRSSDVLYARLDADLLFQDNTQIKLDMTYNDYLGRNIGAYMRYKPAFDGTLYGRTVLMPGLDLMLSYKLKAFHRVNGEAMPTVNDLALTLDYDIMDNLSVYVTGNRLAGGNYYYYAGYRAIRPSLVLGATYRF